MEAGARLLSLLLFLTAVSISTALGVSPESDLNPSALAETTATYNRGPEVTSDVILYKADSEAIQARVSRQRQGRRCTIVNNQRRCMLTRPGLGNVVGRGEKKKQRV